MSDIFYILLVSLINAIFLEIKPPVETHRQVNGNYFKNNINNQQSSSYYDNSAAQKQADYIDKDSHVMSQKQSDTTSLRTLSYPSVEPTSRPAFKVAVMSPYMSISQALAADRVLSIGAPVEKQRFQPEPRSLRHGCVHGPVGSVVKPALQTSSEQDSKIERLNMSERKQATEERQQYKRMKKLKITVRMSLLYHIVYIYSGSIW